MKEHLEKKVKENLTDVRLGFYFFSKLLLIVPVSNRIVKKFIKEHGEKKIAEIFLDMFGHGSYIEDIAQLRKQMSLHICSKKSCVLCKDFSERVFSVLSARSEYKIVLAKLEEAFKSEIILDEVKKHIQLIDEEIKKLRA